MIIISGCASQKTMVNNDEVYEVINSYTTRNKDSKSYKPFILSRKSLGHDWSEYLYYPATVSLDMELKEHERIAKLYDDVLEDEDYNKKIYDSINKVYRQKYMIKNDSLDKIYKPKFHIDSDSLFSLDDHKFMKKQIENNSQKSIQWDKNKLKNVTFDKKGRIFSIPVFSKDGNYAILYSYSTGGATVFYFEKRDGEWKRIGHYLAWIS